MASKPKTTAPPTPGNLFGGSDNSAAQAKHKAFLRYWSSLNGLYQQWLGRNANSAEAKRWFDNGTGTSDYVIRQHIIMSKDWIRSPQYMQQQRMYHYIVGQFFGAGFHLTPKMIQTWTAHNYTQSDVQAYIYRHPHLYEQSNDFKDRVANFHNTFQQVMGYDPSQVTQDETHTTGGGPNTNKGRGDGGPPNPPPTPHALINSAATVSPFDQTQSGTPPPPPPPPPGHGHGGGGNPGGGGGQSQPTTVTTHVNQYEQHLRDAALHFQTTAQYSDWLRTTPLYRQQLAYGGIKAGSSDAGLGVENGVLRQQGLAQRPDLAS